MGNKIIRFIISSLIVLLYTAELSAQQGPYKLSPFPDLWYNSSDGVRFGIRLLGEQESTFKDGPHRLDLGIWGASKWPEDPVSYYLSLTEPVKNWSPENNEFNVQFVSSIRTGFTNHGVSINKRLQKGFNELNYSKFTLSFRQQKLYNDRYPVFPQLWEMDWKSLLGFQFFTSRQFESGDQTIQADLTYNASSQSRSFYKASIDLRRTIYLGSGFDLGFRAFGGTTSNDVLPEFGFGLNYLDMTSWMDSGLMRAGGTVPVSLIKEGYFQYASGPNLRGYAVQEMKSLSRGVPTFYTSVASFNIEIEYPNPVNNLWRDSIVEDLIYFKSYSFFDAGLITSESATGDMVVTENNRPIADGGLGFQLSINIPDYLGNDRGIAIRYEIPFWLSDPAAGKNEFEFRSIIGIGTIIDF